MKSKKIINEIEKIYLNFKERYYSGDFSSVFKALNIISRDEYSPHKLEKFVIFYSLPNTNPKIMILGNNPSFFHEPKNELIQKNSTKRIAEQNLEQVAEKIPLINSYIDHNHKFGKAMRDIFRDINHYHWLEDIVGFNWFFIQTGGGGITKLKELSDPQEFKQLEELCFNLSNTIIKILKPKLVFLFGTQVQKKFNNKIFNRSFDPNETTYVDLTHPSNRNGGWIVSSNDIKTFFHNNKNAYELFN